MENKIEFVLKPVTGAASAGGGYRAILNTAKGDAMDFDDVITEALDRGYIAGVKDILAKSVVKGVLDSMIAGVLKDGMTVALLISRNSGTEDKNAVYLKSIEELVPELRPIAQALADNHRAKMRNPNRKEAGVAASVMESIARDGRFELNAEQSKDPMMNSVLHALEREGQIKGNGTVFVKA